MDNIVDPLKIILLHKVLKNNNMNECLNKYFLPILTGITASDYYDSGVVTGKTDDSKLMYVFAGQYDPVTSRPIYTPGINTTLFNSTVVYDGVLSVDSTKIVYVIGADPTNINNTGIKYTTFKNIIVDDQDSNGAPLTYRKTIFETNNGGRNQFNTMLSPLIKQEEYLGVVFTPEVESDVFINRGIADIFERHALLSEIKTTNDIDTNRDGYIKA